MHRAYEYRIYPNASQRKLIEQTFNGCRLVYNLALEVKQRAWKEHQVNRSVFELNNELPALKDLCPWLKEINAHSLQASIANMGKAYENMYKKRAGYPKFKNKHSEQSFLCPDGARHIDFENNRLTIPKMKGIKVVIDREFEGKIKTVAVSRTKTGKYYVSITVDPGIKQPEKQPITPETTIGIDVGIKDFAILSTGEKLPNPRHLKSSLQRLKVLSRRVSRKKKGSTNRKKAVKRLAIQHEKVANQRKDYLHKSTMHIVRDSQGTMFCVEDLSVKNMMQNHKIAQAISDVGWGEFFRQLKYKCDWYGKTYIEIGRFEASTKTCSCCKAINQTLTLADREWICASCNTIHDRDVNAAENIKQFGLLKHNKEKQTRRGSPGEPVESSAIAGALKQEVLP